MPVAARRAKAKKKMEKLRKQGTDIKPVEIDGRTISRTFWGKAWCEHLESFADYANRLPRGRSYVRNGSVCHLDITKGEIDAIVSGSELYKVKITIGTFSTKKWKTVKNRCTGQIGSLLELLQGKLSENVMSVVTHRKNGLFPLPGEIDFRCNCPDWAGMCKHVAAALYGVGARLDEAPELLFLLRGVDHQELIDAEVGTASAITRSTNSRKRIADDSLGDVFGIEIAKDESGETARIPKPSGRINQTSQGVSRSRSVSGKAVVALRARFGMSQIEFARLLGVSAPSIGKWEKNSGKLNLRTRTLEAFTAAKKLTKSEAQRRLDKPE